MMRAVIDTNVLLVANEQHADVSTECVTECVRRLQAMKKTGVTVIDDGFRILGEYQNKVRGKPAALYSGRIDPGILRSSRIDDREGVTNGCAG
jgi:ABC-type ATPase involved in cell division